MIEQVLTVVVFVLVALRLMQGLRRSRQGDARHLVSGIYRTIRWRHIWPVPFVLAAVSLVATLLVQLPILEWGWWSAIGGAGTPLLGSSSETAGTVWEWVIPLVFIGLLAPAIPLWANAEEQMFRSGAEVWSRRRQVLKTLQFGMIHAVVGIPIGVALALSIGGSYFMAVYLRRFRATGDGREATLESTRAHTAYNGLIVILVVVLITASAIGT